MGYIITHLMALIGTSMGWLMPFIGLMVYYWFSILRPPFLWFWSFPDKYDVPRFSLYIGASTLIGWVFQGFGSLQGLRGTHIPLLGLFTYILCGVIGWQLFAVLPLHAWNQLDTQIKIIVMVFVTLSLVRDARSIRIFIWVVVISLGYLGKVLNDWYFISPMYLHNNGFGGIDNNGVGMIMVMAVPLGFFMAVYDKRWWVRLLTVMAVVYQVHVILFSYSRGSQLGLCMVGAMIFAFAIFQLPRKFLTIGLGLAFVGVTLFLAGDGVRQRFMSIFAEDLDASAESRFSTWSAAWQCMQEHPLGVGPRNFGFYAPQYGLTQGKAVHNLYLQTGADYGVIGMFGLIAFYLGTVVSCFFMARSDVAKALGWPRYVGLGVCTSIGGFMLCSVFIGMESVEAGYIIGAVGLTTVAYVNRVRDASPAGYGMGVPELVEVPPPDEDMADLDRERRERRAGLLRPAMG